MFFGVFQKPPEWANQWWDLSNKRLLEQIFFGIPVSAFEFH